VNISLDQIIQVVTALLPVIIAVIGIAFKLGHDAREELAHAASSTLKRLAAGEIDSTHAKELILATGLAPERKVEKLVSVVDAVNSKVSVRNKQGEPLEVFFDKLIPGVGVTVDTTGGVKIEPLGLANKAAHKISKWWKRRF